MRRRHVLPALAQRRLLGVRPEVAYAHFSITTALRPFAAHALARPSRDRAVRPRQASHLSGRLAHEAAVQ